MKIAILYVCSLLRRTKSSMTDSNLTSCSPSYQMVAAPHSSYSKHPHEEEKYPEGAESTESKQLKLTARHRGVKDFENAKCYRDCQK